MGNLQLNTGLTPYSINGKIEVYFNPTDDHFLEQLSQTIDLLKEKEDTYKKHAQTLIKANNTSEVFALMRKAEVEMRGVIDSFFNVPVCDAVFEGMSIYALADGLPVWANLMFAIMDEVESAVGREQTASKRRIEKYTKKYHR